MKHARTLRELFSFKGFIAKSELEGRFGDPKARVVVLKRQKKQPSVPSAALSIEAITTAEFVVYVIVMPKVIAYIFAMKDDVYIARNVIVFIWSA